MMGSSSEIETKDIKNCKFNHNSISDSDSDSDEILHKKNITELSPGKHTNDNAIKKLAINIKKEPQHTYLNNIYSDVILKTKKKKIKVCKNEQSSDTIKKESREDIEGKIIVKKEKFLNALKNVKQQSSQEIDTKSVKEWDEKVKSNFFESDHNGIHTCKADEEIKAVPAELIKVEKITQDINFYHRSQDIQDVSIKREVETEKPTAKRIKDKHVTNKNIGKDFQSDILKLKKKKQNFNLTGNENSACDVIENKMFDCHNQKDDNDKEKNNGKHQKIKLYGMQNTFIKQEDEVEDETKESTVKKIKRKRKDKHIVSENINNNFSENILKRKRDFDDAGKVNSTHVVIENKMLDYLRQEDDNDKEEKHIKHSKGNKKLIDFCHKSQGVQDAFIIQKIETEDEIKDSTPKKRKHKRKHIANENIDEAFSQDILKQNKNKKYFADYDENESFLLPASSICNHIENENEVSIYPSQEDKDGIKIKNRKHCKGKKPLVKVNAENDLLYENVTKDEYFFEVLHWTNISLNFEVPELHRLIRDVTRHPSPEIRQKILDLGLPLKQGRFTLAEDKIISRNWKRLCSKYNLPDCPEIFARWRNCTNNVKFARARRNAILFLARGLPNRTTVQVYHHFLHSLGCKSKGRFSEKEMEIVELFIENEEYKDLTQQFLAGVLGRDLPSVWRYIKRIKENRKTGLSEKTKVKWTLKLCETFIKKLLCLMNEKHNMPKESLDLDVLKQNTVTKEIWVVLAKEMNLRPIQVKVHWLSKLYVQLFVNEPIYLNPLRRNLLRVLQTKDYKYWQDVNWKEVSLHFENYTPLFLWKKFYTLARLLVPRSKFDNFTDVLKIIYEKLIIDKTPLINKKLQRLALDTDGNLYFKST